MENSNFIRTIIEDDLASKKHHHIITRFPPEPNGFLHLGHARSIIMNYTLAKDFGGTFNLRFDDTNPVKEDAVFIEAIKKDILWLGCPWDHEFYASDYFEEMFERALLLIHKGLAYVDDSSAFTIKEQRGDLKTPGQNSPFRNRTFDENIALFKAMREGQFKDGEKVLRAKIDMAHPNMNMRDPVLYRIQHAHHHRTGNAWCIYPMYDYAHPLEDAIEGITHSLCTLEFEDHRPIYDWVVEHCEMTKIPRQIEFGKLRIKNEIQGKRFINQLVTQKVIDEYDDPRLITLSGLRNKGIPVQAIHQFIHALGLPKSEGETELAMLDEEVRHVLSNTPRIHMIKNPLKVTLTNYPEGSVETLETKWFNEGSEDSRMLPFSKHLYIEKDDFLPEKPNKNWKRLSLGLEVRLMHAYFIKAEDMVCDAEGNVIEILATYDPLTRSGSDFNERKPNGNIHFVEATTALKYFVEEYEPLLIDEADKSLPLEEILNPNALFRYEAWVEPNLTKDLTYFQAIRLGFYQNTPSGFKRVVALKSSFR
jgi:glutaminyl-tRNA synthetase